MVSRVVGISSGSITGFVVLLSIFAARLPSRLGDPDIWWHLKSGEVFIARGGLPAGDLFSFTVPGKRWIAHEWLTEVMLQGIRSAFGLRGVIVWRALMVLAVYAVVARLFVREAGNRVGTWALVALTAFAGSSYWTERPNLVSFLLLGMTLTLLRRRDRAIWWFVPIALVWANMHAMVLLGLGLVALVAIAESLKVALQFEGADARWAKRLGGVTGAAVLAAFVNPFGPALFGHSLALIRQVSRFNTEWASPDFHKLVPMLFLALVLIAIGGLALSPSRPDPTDIALLGAFVFLGLYAVRNLLPASIVIGFVAARYAPPAVRAALARRRGDEEVRPRTPPARVPLPLGVMLLAAVAGVFGARVARDFPRSDALENAIRPHYPVRILRELGDDDVRLFANDFWAGFALWLRWPQVRVAFDGRVDLYGTEVQDVYVRTSAGNGPWEETLRRMCVTHVLMPEGSGLATVLERDPDWVRIASERLERPSTGAPWTAVLWTPRTPIPGCAGNVPPAELAAPIEGIR